MDYRADMVDEAEEAEPAPAQPPQPAAWLALALLSGVWAWWAAKEGAYFGVVLLPGGVVLCVGAALILYYGRWRARLRLSPPVIVALGALTALGVWALLSALWSPSPDQAVGDGQRILIYALSFAIGLGLCNLLGDRIGLSLVPLAAAGAFAGLLTVAHLATGDAPKQLLELDGTLDFPIGYRNAEAAFFAIAMFPAIGLAMDRGLHWLLRGAALGTASLCIELFLLAQSRASIPAVGAALIVFALVSPHRVRALCWFALALLPALAILPALLDLYAAADDGITGVVPEMNHTGVVAALSVLGAALLGAIVARFERRLPGLRNASPTGNRFVSVAIAVALLASVVGFVVATGDPEQWINDRVDEFKEAGSPDLSAESTRFTFNAGSDRYDAWRVALDDFSEDPILGDGGGGYHYTYLLKRDVATQEVHDAHSVELEVLAELGAVGLILFATAIVAIVLAIARARRLNPAASTLAAVAFASGAYWLTHASLDWFWPYPALTAPVFALVGSACAPAIRTRERHSTRRWRIWVIAGLAVLALSAIPPWLSERFVNNAYSSWRTDLARAYEDLDRARQLNALSDTPLLAEGSIAREAGDRERALDAFNEAAEIRPEEWATHYLLAEMLAESDPAAAREQIRLALERNPLDVRGRQLAAVLGVPRPPGPNAVD